MNIVSRAWEAVKKQVQERLLAKWASDAKQAADLDKTLETINTAKVEFNAQAAAFGALFSGSPAPGKPGIIEAYEKLRKPYYEMINATDAYCRKVLRLDLDQQQAREYIKDVIDILTSQPTAFQALTAAAAQAELSLQQHTKGHTLGQCDTLLSRFGNSDQIDEVNRARYPVDCGLPLIVAAPPTKRWWMPLFEFGVAFLGILLVFALLRTAEAFVFVRRHTRQTLSELRTAINDKTAIVDDDGIVLPVFDSQTALIILMPYRDRLRACLLEGVYARAAILHTVTANDRKNEAYRLLDKVGESCDIPFVH